MLFRSYVAPFFISTAVGSALAGALVLTLEKSGALGSVKSSLEC